MKKNTIVRALAGTLLAATALSATAKVVSFNVGFVTIKDVELTQTQALSYGQNILGTAGTTCDAPYSVTGATFAAASLTDGTLPTATELVPPVLAGTGCSTSTGALLGLYRVVGNTAQTVNITVASVAGADFNFNPSGVVVDSLVDQTGVTPVFFADTPVAISPGTGETDTGIIVGGTITIGATTLTPNTPYSTTFDITATY